MGAGRLQRLPGARAVPALHHCHRASADCRWPLTYLILIGDGLHNLLGGLAVGAAFLAGVRLGVTTWLADAPAQERERAEGLLGSGDFLPVKKALYTTCHVRASAGGDCVTCHNYHVGLFPTAPRMPAPDTGDLGRPKDQPGSNRASPPT